MVKACCICKKNNASYKCPTCREPYCSVACYKEHKSQLCESPRKPEEPEKHRNIKEWNHQFPTEDTVPLEKLQQLRHNIELKETLKNPHLRDIMMSIIDSPDPTEAIALAMREPIFVEMADACLKVVELPDEAKPC